MCRKPGKAKPGSLRKPERMAAAESRSSDALASCWLRAAGSRIRVWAALALNGIQPALPLLSCSGIRSKFKAPKTPPSHGLTGFAAIKAGAKKRCFQGEFQNLAAKDWRPEANGPCIPQKDRQRHESAQAAPGFATPFRNPISQPHFATQAAPCSAPCAHKQKPNSPAPLLPLHHGRNARTGTPHPNAARPQPVWRRLHGLLFFFREQIQGPKNASIARFGGLGCYQSRSEIRQWLCGRGRKAGKTLCSQA